MYALREPRHAVNPAVVLTEPRRVESSHPRHTKPEEPRPQPKPPKSRQLRDYFKAGDWKGQRCWIIGGGPSLRGFNWKRLRGELVIGTNRALEAAPCAINVSMDNAFLRDLERGYYGAGIEEKYKNNSFGFSVWVNTVKKQYPEWIYEINGDRGRFATTFDELLGTGGNITGNSGFCAINMACVLGSNPIYLIGFDGGSTQRWWHSGHRKKQPGKVYCKFHTDFTTHAVPGARAAGAEIVNLNTSSQYECFEFGEIDEVPEIKRPVIVAYATEGTGYVDELSELANSLRKWGFERDLQVVPNLGSWQSNTQYKAQFIKGMLQKHAPRSVLYVDADARVLRYPSLFCNFEGDFAAHWSDVSRNGSIRIPKLRSGTLYFANNERGRGIVDAWISENRKAPKDWDQVTLARCVSWRDEGAVNLPVEYCAIFDRDGCKEPVIEHRQASRRLKREVDARPGP
jgi:hypothetical protein